MDTVLDVGLLSPVPGSFRNRRLGLTRVPECILTFEDVIPVECTALTSTPATLIPNPLSDRNKPEEASFLNAMDGDPEDPSGCKKL